MTTNEHQLGHRQRLKDRFLKDAGNCMADYELLELLLTIAQPRKDVKPLAKNLINKFGSLAAVVNAPLEELTEVSGVGQSIATTLKIVAVTAQRASWQKLSDNNQTVISCWDSLIDYCIANMRYNKIEVFMLIFLDNAGKIINKEILQTGTLDAVYVYPREVVNAVLKNKAKSVILTHNHPSGDTTPSKADVEMTSQIIKALKAIDVIVWDHVIVADTGYYSFKEKGLLNQISTTSNI